MQTRIKSNNSSQVFNLPLNGPLKEYLLNTFEENVPTGRAVTKLELFHDIMRLTKKCVSRLKSLEISTMKYIFNSLDYICVLYSFNLNVYYKRAV